MLPDVVQDHVTDAATRLGFRFTEQVFYLAALDAGFSGRAEDKARELDTIWKKGGWEAFEGSDLAWVRAFILDACNGRLERQEVI